MISLLKKNLNSKSLENFSIFISIAISLEQTSTNRYPSLSLRPSRKGSSVLPRLDVVDSPLEISRELPQGWRTLAATKKPKRDKELLITYAKTYVKSRVVRLIEKSLRNLDGKSLYIYIYNAPISRQFLYFQFREKNLLSPRLIFSLLLYSVSIDDRDKT